jgi:hypothetical protein
MKDELARKVHVNSCVRDSEIEELERLCQEADPGDWRVVDGEVQRYGGAPFERREASLRLMARARNAIPRLLRGIRVLEEALQTAWASAESNRAEWLRERDGREQDALRRAGGHTGPEEEIAMLARLALYGAFQPRYIEELVRRWAGGQSIAHLRQEAVDAEVAAMRRAEADRVAREQLASDRAELTRLLELARAGKLPVDLARAGGRRRG